jgi:hypothetical protein
MATKTNGINETHESPVAQSLESKPYSIFTRGEKWVVVSIASIAATYRWAVYLMPHYLVSPMLNCLSSPLTANIYFPAVPTIAAAFHKSIELINITVTVYMVFQGICQILIVYPKL